VYDNGDTALRSFSRNTPLSADTSYTLSNQSVTLNGTLAGDVYLLFRTDRYSDVSESDETNNVTAVPIHINAADLQVTGTPTISQNPVEEGNNQTVNLTWTVTNTNGAATASSSSWTDRVFISSDQVYDGSDTLVTSQTHNNAGGLAAGAH